MTDKVRLGVATLSWVLWACLSGSAVVGLAGCATNASGTGSNSDLVTESDEPEGRKRARLRLELAVAYFDKGQTTDALDHLKQSIAADPTLFEAYNLRGLIYMRLNDLALADESFRRALSINPKAASVQHNYGWMLCQQSRYPEALQMFGNALGNPAYGDRAKTWMAQGLCQQRADNWLMPRPVCCVPMSWMQAIPSRLTTCPCCSTSVESLFGRSSICVDLTTASWPMRNRCGLASRWNVEWKIVKQWPNWVRS